MSSIPSVTDDLLADIDAAINNAEQAVFEDWLASSQPSGDVDSIRRQWEDSSELSDFVSRRLEFEVFIARIRAIESTLREVVAYLDRSAIQSGSVMHETMRAAPGDRS